MKKVFALLALTLALSFGAFAQTYNTATFFADFNGSVDVSNFSNETNTNVSYNSSANGVSEHIIVRTVNHDIDVNLTSSQFYRGNVKDVERIEKFDNDGTYQGHPFSYGYYVYNVDGVRYVLRERFIIVSSREVIFIQMVIPENLSDSLPSTPGTMTLKVWNDFENSLGIK
jgi:hypothetical protein